MSITKPTQHIDGNNLTLEHLVRFSTGEYILDLTEEAWKRVSSSRQIVQNILDSGEVAYGINTGFGLFSKVVIDEAVFSGETEPYLIYDQNSAEKKAAKD